MSQVYQQEIGRSAAGESNHQSGCSLTQDVFVSFIGGLAVPTSADGLGTLMSNDLGRLHVNSGCFMESNVPRADIQCC